MTPKVLQGLLAVVGVTAVGFLPSSCQSGGIGDPCTPEDEFFGNFAGFKVTQENIESRSFQCESRICLVNHFQGRVSCPMGQEAKTPCAGPDASCPDIPIGGGKTLAQSCVESATSAPDCEKDEDCSAYANKCSPDKFCECAEGTCPEGFVCDGDSKQCKLYVCHAEGHCQDADATNEANSGKDCCIPGTDTPVSAGVCGQCDDSGLRNAANSVYCSCRCGVAEGQAEDENFNFCECPEGFQCAEVRPDVGLGDKQLTGKYCVKADDPIVEDGKVEVALAATKCGAVAGQRGDDCIGTNK